MKAFMAGDNDIIESRIAGQDAIVLDIRGALNTACEKDLWREFENGIEKSKNILLNLSELPHINTEGACLLVMYTVRAARKNLSVAAYGLTDSLWDVFRLQKRPLLHSGKSLIVPPIIRISEKCFQSGQ